MPLYHCTLSLVGRKTLYVFASERLCECVRISFNQRSFDQELENSGEKPLTPAFFDKPKDAGNLD